MAPDERCPCGTGSYYGSCCGAFHRGDSIPATALELMRSRYSAFAKCEIAYLQDTLWPPHQKQFDALAHEMRSKGSAWLGLKIVDTEEGAQTDKRGTVHFIATSLVGGNLDKLEERSLFRKKNGRWYYVRPL